MGNFFKDELNEHYISMRSKFVLNTNEVVFICYLFGETRNPAGKEELLELTHDSNVRVRTAAVNALGKIRVDSTDLDFTDRVSARLRELAEEVSPYKLYKKDIAYAFKNYNNFNNIASLTEMMRYDYFGVRFTAAEALRIYGDEYFRFITDELIQKISGDRIWYLSFLNSIEGLSTDKFRIVLEKCIEANEPDDDLLYLKYAEILKNRLKNSSDPEFNKWAEEKIKGFQSKSILKIN